uniref:GNAT family N-acetyltransferase n=1 Tax=Streptomyces sp. NBC_00008 TaxID=2903610 RepID=A0AAU2VKQ2_9ACTN
MHANTTFGGMTAGEWDRLAGEKFYSTSAWLRFCSAEAGTDGRAVTATSARGPVCGVPVRELTGLPEWSRYRWNQRLSEAELPLLPDSGLLVGPPEGFQTHFLTAPGANGAAAESMRSLVALLRAEAARPPDGDTSKDVRGCTAMYVTTEGAAAAREAGVTAEPVLLDADAWIPVPAGGWEPWLDSLPSKRRRNVRHEDRAFRAAGYRIEHLPLSACVEKLGKAAASTLWKYGHQTTPETELISLRRVAEILGDLASVAVCWLEEGDPLGFCIYYQWGDTVYLRWAGFDYERLAGSAEYFNLLYYSQIQRSPETGIRWIHAGATAQAAKALRGAELRPLWMLDLGADSPHERGADQVREHNARMRKELLDDPRTAASLTGDWAGLEQRG